LRGFWLEDRLVLPGLNLVTWNGERAHLEPKAMEVLVELAKRPGEVLSKADLIQSVWGGVFVCDEVVTNAISLVRRALGDRRTGSSLIQTIPKRGYRLIATVHPESDGAELSNLKQALLRVRYLRHEETVPSLTSARAYCEELIRQEPKCAAAYAELAMTFFLLEKLGAMRHEEIEPHVRAAVDRARTLDDGAGMTLVCLAKQEYRYDWQWERSEQRFRQAMEASPCDADVCTEFSLMLSVLRRFDESLTYTARACRLDPISPPARLQAGHANYSSGRWAAAADQYRRLLRFTPQHVFARWGLADALTRAGQPHESIAVLSEGVAMAGVNPNPLLLTSLSRTKSLVQCCEARIGSLEQETNDPILLAEFYGSLGEIARAFRHLDEAVEKRHYRLSAVNMFPQFEPLRADARYEKLLKTVGLRQPSNS
jgi:DNA-binding winged helix-turn-helix (wHTH) protein